MDKRKWNKYLKFVLQEELQEHEPNIDIINTFEKYFDKSIKMILDIGAGIGVDVHELLLRDYMAFGLEIDKNAINYAKNTYDINLNEGDMHNIPFPGCMFDAILSIQVFEHSICPIIAIGEMNRILKPNGLVFIDMPDYRDESMYGLRHPNLVPPEQVIALFTNMGFEMVENLSQKHRTQIIFKKGIDIINLMLTEIDI